MFDDKNLILPAIFLSFCLSVHNTYAQPRFSHYFIRKIFALFLSPNLCIIYFAKMLHLFAKQTEAKFREKSENVHIFRERTKCKNEAKWSR